MVERDRMRLSGMVGCAECVECCVFSALFVSNPVQSGFSFAAANCFKVICSAAHAICFSVGCAFVFPDPRCSVLSMALFPTV